MKDTSVEKEILDEIHKLGKGQQAEVLEFVRALAKSDKAGRRTRQDSAALCRNDR